MRSSGSWPAGSWAASPRPWRPELLRAGGHVDGSAGKGLDSRGARAPTAPGTALTGAERLGLLRLTFTNELPDRNPGRRRRKHRPGVGRRGEDPTIRPGHAGNCHMAQYLALQAPQE
jgi:hypothetical protein